MKAPALLMIGLFLALGSPAEAASGNPWREPSVQVAPVQPPASMPVYPPLDGRLPGDGEKQRMVWPTPNAAPVAAPGAPRAPLAPGAPAAPYRDPYGGYGDGPLGLDSTSGPYGYGYHPGYGSGPGMGYGGYPGYGGAPYRGNNNSFWPFSGFGW